MSKPASLVLEDGSVFEGYAFGAEKPGYGEVVFNTAMTGYQEMLTDPSYAGQIVVPTYPLIGNYGINGQDFESGKVQVSGFVVREHCLSPSHSSSTSTVGEFLAAQGVPGISGVDTRAITRRLRTRGVMMGAIAVDETPESALERLRRLPSYGEVDFVAQVTTDEPYEWDQAIQGASLPPRKHRIVVDDCGLKYNIMRMLRSRGCEVVAVPAQASAGDILARRPDGVVLSPGPGDPELLDYAVETARGLVGRLPILGICLGNQVLARAFGGRNFKLKFGPPRRQPSGARPEHRPGTHHRPEPRIRRRPGQPAAGGRGQSRQPQRRHRRGPAPPVAARHEHPVPLRGVPRPTGQRVHLRPVPGHGA